MAFNPRWRQSAGARAVAAMPSRVSSSASAPPPGHPAAAPSSGSRGYVPSTASTLRAAGARPHPQNEDWFRGDPDGEYSWSDMARDTGNGQGPLGPVAAPIKGIGDWFRNAPRQGAPHEDPAIARAEVEQGSIKPAEDMTVPELQALGWQGNTSDTVLEALGADVSEVRANDEAILAGERAWREAAVTEEVDRRERENKGVVTRDESNPNLPTWGTGYQSISKEDVLKNLAEPVEIDEARYNRMDERQRAAVDFNTLLYQSDQNGDRTALNDALGLELDPENDQMISQALLRQLGNDPVSRGALQARTAAVTQATKFLGREAAGTTSGWEAEGVSQQINDMLNDRLAQSTLAVQEATQGGYNLQALPQTQAFEVMFNDLADTDQGDWTADELVGLLQQGGYDPDEFWNWAGQRLTRFQQAGAGGTLAPVENARSAEDMASRLQIDLGG